jgi:hypothetical protein
MAQRILLGDVAGAEFSPCRTWRYALWRKWSDDAPVAFIGLNPSTADENINDPTIRRCIAFAKAWEAGGLVMLNLFAFRATKPEDMLKAPEPVGTENDATLLKWADRCERVVAAWGVDGNKGGRAGQVCRLLDRPLWCLGATKAGCPRHPLYVRASQPLVRYSVASTPLDGVRYNVEVGCPKCGNLATCTCPVEKQHAEGCRYRTAACLSIELACEHGFQACPICDPCTCGADPNPPGIR